MPCWDTRGNAICQSCKTMLNAGPNRQKAIQFLRAAGWHHSKGVTIGGDSYEALLCPHCAHDEKRRKIVRPSIEQDGLPLDWSLCAAVPQEQGSHTQ